MKIEKLNSQDMKPKKNSSDKILPIFSANGAEVVTKIWSLS